MNDSKIKVKIIFLELNFQCHNDEISVQISSINQHHWGFLIEGRGILTSVVSCSISKYRPSTLR